MRIAAIEAAVDAGLSGAEGDVVGSVVLKAPAKNLPVERFCLLDVSRGELDVVDLVMISCIGRVGHGVSPYVVARVDAKEGRCGLAVAGTPFPGAPIRLHPQSLKSRRVQVESAGWLQGADCRGTRSR